MSLVAAVGIAREESLGLVDWLVRSAGRSSPQVLFFPTGLKDDPAYSAAVEAGLRRAGARVATVSLTRNPPVRAVEQAFAAADIVYVGGGAAPLIAKHGNRYGLADKLRAALARGAVLAGVSGGAIALFEGGAGAYNGYRPLSGWGLAPGGLLPHFRPGEEHGTAPWFAENPGRALYGVEDGAVLTWDGSRMAAIGPVWELTWDGSVSLRPVSP